MACKVGSTKLEACPPPKCLQSGGQGKTQGDAGPGNHWPPSWPVHGDKPSHRNWGWVSLGRGGRKWGGEEANQPWGSPEETPPPGSARPGGSCAGHCSSPRALGLGRGSPAGRSHSEQWSPVRGGRPDATLGGPAPWRPSRVASSLLGSFLSVAVLGAGTREGVRPSPEVMDPPAPVSPRVPSTCPPVHPAPHVRSGNLAPLVASPTGPWAGGGARPVRWGRCGRGAPPMAGGRWGDPSAGDGQMRPSLPRPNGTVWG